MSTGPVVSRFGWLGFSVSRFPCLRFTNLDNSMGVAQVKVTIAGLWRNKRLTRAKLCLCGKPDTGCGERGLGENGGTHVTVDSMIFF